MASTEYIDPRRPLQRYLGNYSEDHRNLSNQRIHLVCVPLIVWSVVALLWTIPVPGTALLPGTWAALAMFAAWLYYWKLSRPLGLGMLLAFALAAAINYLLAAALGMRGLLWLAIGVFVGAWIGQFIGHKIEGRRPSFLTDLTYLLIGPLWTLGKLYRKLRIAY